MSDFVIPSKTQPRDRYRAEATRTDEGGWPVCNVRIMDENDNIIYEYERGYSMLQTFEPFRQFRDGEWHDYALISPQYTSFQVLDLEKGEVIAIEQPSERALEYAREVIERYTTGIQKDADSKYATWVRTEATPEDVARGYGFCPVEFYVPDWWEEWADEDETPESMTAMRASASWWEAHDDQPQGNWAVYCGCVWGDDTSWKIRYIDLSRISEGVVTADDRFGYVSLPDRLSLREAVKYWPETDRLEIAVSMHFDRTTGEAGKWYRDEINWGGDD